MAPTITGTLARRSTSNNVSYIVNLPPGIVAGEMLVVIISAYGNNTISVPADWTKLGQNGVASAVSSVVAWKIATSSEPASVTFTNTASRQYSSFIFRVSGGKSIAWASATSTLANTDPPIFTGSFQDYLWIAARSGQGIVAPTEGPSGYANFQTQVAVGATGATTSIATRTTISTTEDPGAFTVAAASAVAATIAISGNAGPEMFVEFFGR